MCNCRCSCGYIGFEALGGLLECVSTSSSVKVYHVTSGTNSKHVFPPGRKRIQEIVFKTMRGCGCVASYGPRDLALGRMIHKIGGECERKFWALGICLSFTWAPITEFVVPRSGAIVARKALSSSVYSGARKVADNTAALRGLHSAITPPLCTAPVREPLHATSSETYAPETLDALLSHM